MESMITDLEIVPHEIGAPRKIKVHKFQLQNFQMHTCLVALSRMLKALIKMGSNNASVELTPRDISALRLQFSGYLAVWDFALKHNNQPQAAHEFDYYVLVPTKSEIQQIKNHKLKQVSLHIDRLIEILLSADSARLNANVGNQTSNDIKVANATCVDAMDMFIGSGSDNDNTGMVMPVLKALGTERPDTDMDIAAVREPSPDASQAGRPDVPDFVAGD